MFLIMVYCELMYITMATTFSHAYSTQRRPHTGIIAIPMYIKSVQGQFGRGVKILGFASDFKFPSPKLTFNYYI